MGNGSSKSEKVEALKLCRERKRFIKQAIDSRYNLAAAHVSYINSLRNIGIALRRFAEAEVLLESSLSITSDKTPSHSSYPSPSLSHVAEVSDSPLHHESPPVVSLSYMRSGGGGNVVTVKLDYDNGNDCYMDDELVNSSMPMPPPPPPFEAGGSWDYFDPADDCESFRFVGHSEFDVDFDDARGWNEFRSGQGIGHNIVDAKGKWANFGSDGIDRANEGVRAPGVDHKCFVSSDLMAKNGGIIDKGSEGFTSSSVGGQMRQVDSLPSSTRSELEQSSSKKEKPVAEKDLPAEREDPSEFITHRAKDFLSSIKDIEHRFFRASESGKEISKLLEANGIRVEYAEGSGKSSTSGFVAALRVCCLRKSAPVEPGEHVTKVITWKRTTSSKSSSSRNPLTASAKDDMSDSGSDFIEEFCMIAGSHSSTLDRLYAWERKLYDEVKAMDRIRKEYDRKCNLLKHQCAKDQSSHVIDKTRAVVKDLHSQIKVAIHSVDSIAKRIEKMRDEELQPQLLELIQGFIRMWKAMLECHHAQYITISLAYHSRNTVGTPQGDTRREIMTQLQQEIECFGLSFANWVNAHASYVEAINGWLQNCILQPRERSKRGRPFSPRRDLAPPIFVLCRDWSAGFKALPAEELSNGIKDFLTDLRHLMDLQREEIQEQDKLADAEVVGGAASRDDDKIENGSSNLYRIHSSLTKVLDRLHKFSEASLKMYEDIRLKNETARVAYLKGRPRRY